MSRGPINVHTLPYILMTELNYGVSHPLFLICCLLVLNLDASIAKTTASSTLFY